ncbi:hypothetical protein [Limnobacter sp.]|uniref:hypothetical protein n=1 Tax=Limnobacter sp. TaxID=2003368 RepID=UPI0035151CAA
MIVKTLALALLGLAPGAALAHAFGEPVQLPMPYDMYILGCVLALLLSFALLALAGRRNAKASPVLALSLPIQANEWRRIQHVGAVLLLLALVFCVVAGLLGSRDSQRNINMTFFWIWFALGGAYLSMLIGPWYKHQHPWACLPLGHARVKYPAWLGHWPALLQFVGLVAIELFVHSNPRTLAVLIAAWLLFNGLGIWAFGATRWLQRGEPFAVLFRLFADCSPIRLHRPSHGRIRIRLTWPFARFHNTRIVHPAHVLFVFFLLASTAYDGLRETKVYFNVFWQDPLGLLTSWFGQHPMKIYPTVRPVFIAWEVFLLMVLPLVYLGLFAGFLALGRWVSRGKQSLWALVCVHTPSLVPIAVVYHLTHYYTLLFSQGLKIRGMVSDPFGWGWNIFGNAITGRLPWLPDMANIWASQVVLILLGHVAAVWLAHRHALRLERSPVHALLNQLPMLVLMVIFTSVGLWVLAQPLQG